MKLPIVKGKTQLYLPQRICPVCGHKGLHEPNSFAWLSGGAYLGESVQSAQERELEGFLNMGWHGAHSDMGGKGPRPEAGGQIVVAEDAAGGQFELYFCSTKCLRGFFNVCVDKLEQKMAHSEKKLTKSKAKPNSGKHKRKPKG